MTFVVCISKQMVMLPFYTDATSNHIIHQRVAY